MKIFNFTEVRKNFASVLNLACKEDVIISRKNGQKFKIVPITQRENKSPLDVKGIDCDVSTKNIVDVIREFREV